MTYVAASQRLRRDLLYKLGQSDEFCYQDTQERVNEDQVWPWAKIIGALLSHKMKLVMPKKKVSNSGAGAPLPSSLHRCRGHKLYPSCL